MKTTFYGAQAVNESNEDEPTRQLTNGRPSFYSPEPKVVDWTWLEQQARTKAVTSTGLTIAQVHKKHVNNVDCCVCL